MRFFHFIGSLAFLLVASHAVAQDAQLRVKVDGAIYVVTGSTVTDQTGGPVDKAGIVRKAAFTARVLDEQILHSEFNKNFFDVTNRLRIFSDEASGRLAEPWRRPILNGASGEDPTALGAAKARFKAWATNLADNPTEAALAIVRNDYQNGIYAYRQNAAIYRKVTKQGEALSFEEATEFLGDQSRSMQLVSASALERKLSESATASNQNNAGRLSQRLQSEIIGRIDAAGSARDLDKASQAIRRTATAEMPSLKTYVDSVRPATIRFQSSKPEAKISPQVGSGASNIRPANTNAIKITVPSPLSANKIVDITGGILPSPYPLTRPPANDNRAAAPNSAQPNQPAGGQQAPAGANGNQGVVAGGSRKAASAGTATDNPGASSDGGQSSNTAAVENPDNLLNYSSKPYHDIAGWVFNPASGFWQNPEDPSETRMPGIITCCDDTGLAFPNDAVEAQQAFWDLGGVDPNCGRLYSCDGGGGQPTTETASSAPTDEDAQILAAIDYFESLPVEQFNGTWRNFLRSLPPQYRVRAHRLFLDVRDGARAGIGRPAAPRGGTPIASRYFSSQNYPRQPTNQSTITGIGGVSSQYTPVTQSFATNVTAAYPVVPTCK